MLRIHRVEKIPVLEIHPDLFHSFHAGRGAATVESGERGYLPLLSRDKGHLPANNRLFPSPGAIRGYISASTWCQWRIGEEPRERVNPLYGSILLMPIARSYATGERPPVRAHPRPRPTPPLGTDRILVTPYSVKWHSPLLPGHSDGSNL